MSAPELLAAVKRAATRATNGSEAPRGDGRALGERLVAAGVVVALVAVTVQSVGHLVNELALDGRVTLLDADGEGTFFAWAASVAIFAGGLVMFVHALILEGGDRWRYGALSAVLVFLSLDEIIQVHERLGTAVGGDLLGLPAWADVRLWLVIYTPLLLVTLLLLLGAASQADDLPRRSIRGGVGLLVAAIAIEGSGLLTKWLEERGTDLPDVLRITVEEATELAGWLLIAAGLTAATVTALLRTYADRPAFESGEEDSLREQIG
jgi:hypothetical protein